MESKRGLNVGQIDRLSLNDMNREPIVVTHVENPEKFYCRLASDEHKLKELNELIWSVCSIFDKILDPIAGEGEAIDMFVWKWVDFRPSTHKINLDLNSTNFDGKKTILESIYFVGSKLKLSLK